MGIPNSADPRPNPLIILDSKYIGYGDVTSPGTMVSGLVILVATTTFHGLVSVEIDNDGKDIRVTKTVIDSLD